MSSRATVVGAALTTLVVAAAVAAGTTGAVSSRPSTAQNGTTTVTTCTTIDEPGTYVVARNVTQNASDSPTNRTREGTVYDPDSAEPCLDVTASDVVVRGQGHTLYGNEWRPDSYAPEPTGDLPAGVRVHDGAANVTVRNLTVREFGTGVALTGVSDATVADVRTARNTWGITLASTAGVTVTDSNASDNFFGGGVSVVDASDTVVRDTAVLRNEYMSIRGSSQASVRVVGSRDTLLAGNTVRRGDVVRVADSSGTTLRGNEIRRLVGPGVGKLSLSNASGTTVVDNTLAIARGEVEVDRTSEDVVVRGNTLDGSRATIGLTVDVSGARVTLANNTATDTRVELEPRADGATVTDNEFAGDGSTVVLDGSANATVSDNAFSGGFVAVELTDDVDGTTVARNVVSDAYDGVRIRGVRGNVSVVDNTLRDGERHGIHAANLPRENETDPDCPSWNVSVTIRGNVVADNAEAGIFNESPRVIDATDNYWGAASGPSSVDDGDAPFADPVTGTLADGAGDAVTEGDEEGVSNVHFDPFLTNESAAGA